MNEEPHLTGADAVSFGPETRAVAACTPIKPGDLTDEHVGKSLDFHDHAAQLNIPGRILRVRHLDHVEDGLAPGVTVWVRYPPRPDGTPARDDVMHVPDDAELQLVEVIVHSPKAQRVRALGRRLYGMLTSMVHQEGD